MWGLYRLATGLFKKGGLSIVLRYKFLEPEAVLTDFTF